MIEVFFNGSGIRLSETILTLLLLILCGLGSNQKTLIPFSITFIRLLSISFRETQIGRFYLRSANIRMKWSI